LNPYGLTHRILSPARLPIPPLPRLRSNNSIAFFVSQVNFQENSEFPTDQVTIPQF
jgi:hypothetical protein